jgi:hypothetical protein
MSDTNTGGPAFPFPAYTYPNGEINHGEDGMALRDYFAAKAMQGLLSDSEVSGTPEEFSTRAYSMADAMIKVRNQ